METVADNVLNVSEIEPRLKHPTIFVKFDELISGESLVLHNDHDPKPLYYELMAERGDIFQWQYLEQGPEIWKVKITKNKVAHADENVLNVSALEPRLKHPTIFARFDELQAGESFILHNDHDPRPLYYQLIAQRGDIFSWEYLQQGPQLFRIKITKNTHEANEDKQLNSAGASAIDNILNVTEIEPRLKHPTIFVKFDELVSGEDLIIHNDHDPKPLYYQLLGERGNIFTWEYLEQGPQLWRVKITKKLSGENDETLGEIAVKDLRKAEIFKKYGLDFCCGGKKTVKQACAEKGIDVTKVEQELQAADKTAPGATSAQPLPYNDWSLDFLADYIVNTHHSYVKKTIPDLLAYSNKVTKVHGGQHPELATINKLVQEICDEMTEHMEKEESLVFPFVKHVASKNRGAKFNDLDSLKAPIELMEDEHDFVGRHLEKVRSLTNDYVLPADACGSYAFLYKILQEFESDLFTHIHLENNILFPKALEIEKQIS